MTSLLASLTFEMGSKLFIEETDKNFELFKEYCSDFLDFEILRSPFSLKTRHRVLFTSAEREVKDSQREGMYQFKVAIF